jgi:hypothetical protein
MMSEKNIVVLLIGDIDYDSRVQKEISTFISLGYNVTLVIWSWIPICYDNEKITVIDVNLSNYKEPNNAFTTIWRFIRFWFISAGIIRRGNYKYIHCNDLNTLGVVLFLSRRDLKKVIYDAHELYPEQYENNSIKYKIWTFIEKHLVKKINIIIVPELHRANYIKQKYTLKTNPYVINNFPEYQIISPKNIKRELNLSNDKIIICYQGVIGQKREIENTIESLKFLPEDFILLLIGYGFGDYIEQLKQHIIERKLENRVFFYGKVRPEEMLQTVSGCDISIALYQNDRINSYLCASNKVFDAIMAGVKIITNDYPSLKMLIKYRFVRLISNTNPKAIAKCVIDLANDSSEISDVIRQKFCWQSFNEAFRNIYR